MTLKLALPNWWERLQAGQSLVPELPLLPDGERAVQVLNRLRLADVPGTPALATAGGEWFRDVVRALFGALDPVTGARLIRELFLLVPKKNSKTTNGALLMLTALLLNQRPNAPFIMTAPVHDVAEIAFSAAKGAIELDPVLKKLLHVREHLKLIVHRQTKAELQIMTFDPAVLTGQKVVGALIDELHVVAKMSKAASAIRQLRGGMLPFPEAFLAFITTQSEDAPAGVFKAELKKARAIRDGKLEAAMLPVLFEFPEKVQSDPAKPWRSPQLWKYVTPNAGRSITVERLVEEFRTAEASGEGELRAWASQHLNVEIGLALHSDRWVGADFWEKQAHPEGVTLDELIDRCEVVTVGIDFGGLDDWLGLAVLGREIETGNWLHWAHAWAHPIALERRKEQQQRFADFQEDGDLTIIETVGDDVLEVVEIVMRLHDIGLLDKVGVDRWRITEVYDALIAAGLDPELIIAVEQGWKLVGAIGTVERKLASGRLRHAGSAMMAWCVGNAKVEPKGNAIAITKQAAGASKIDPLMATFNAAYLLALNPPGRVIGEDYELVTA